jgi:hypothetical protein
VEDTEGQVGQPLDGERLMHSPEDEPGLQPVQVDRWETLVGKITRAAAPELSRRRQEQTLTYVFAQWSRPVISAAAVLTLIFGSLLGIYLETEPGPEVRLPTLAEVLIPEDLAPWLNPGNEPTLAEMVGALEGEVR